MVYLYNFFNRRLHPADSSEMASSDAAMSSQQPEHATGGLGPR